MKLLMACFFLGMVGLNAQYRGVLTTKDHLPGNVLATDFAYSTISSSGETRSTSAISETKSIADTLSLSAEKAPLSRSYYLWAEQTGSIPFAGGFSEILLAAATVNGYEDLSQISVTGPKTGVNATRFDLPLQMSLTYSPSTGNTATFDGSAAPTTATSHTQAGSTVSFTSTDTTPSSVGFSYKTGRYGSTDGEWIGPFTLFSGGTTTYTLVPSALPLGANGFTDESKWTIHFALQQSSVRELAALSSFTVFPIPFPSGGLVKTFGKIKRNGEKISPTRYHEYDFEADPAGFPDLAIAATNGFPTSRWELLHVKPDASSEVIASVPAGASLSDGVDFPLRSVRLSDRLQEAGTHYFRLYNRFDNIAIPESSELISEWRFNTTHFIKVKAHIHTYE